ncbi:phosphatidate cytidylyltransferase [Marinospirillum alkaliphilum]|uniref:Phosphatidate cytidylyltransferase n=1 Tax=Marinospirillum alkaliphilum DSM 21637 TaxID=1122209 RepID=A0A1K1W2H0_9GAMM|nr:phosphatidate cytidylyltransferase [Marinospirillum alkaliphilum]SFX31600.1 phosphatidate cytidylyltransferase [Marinospirillum alkaliphilum DSM 21637]
MLKQRIITALLLAPLALWGLFGLEGQAFALFTGVVIGIAAWEWARLSGLQRVGQVVFPGTVLVMLFTAWQQPHLLHQALWLGLAWWALALFFVITYPRTATLWRCSSRRIFMGLFVLIPAWAGFVLLREQGWFWLLYVLLIAWVADIFAYFAGRAFGKHKLAPAVSPGKSWEGVAGGLVGTSLLALLASFWQNFGISQFLLLLLITLVITAVSVLGDLTESLVKRESGMKDSSNLLPGHGGFMDRIDSLTSAVPLFALLLLNLAGDLL